MRVIAMKNKRAEFSAMKTLIQSNRLSAELLPFVEIIREDANYDVAKWSELFCGRPLFVDYLRCDVKRYSGHDAEQVRLIYQLNNNLPLYQEKLRGLIEYPNVIPVVAIREGIDKLSSGDAFKIIDELRQSRNGRPVAVRLEDFKGYEGLLENALLEDDYLFYDISEQRFASKIMEHMELNDLRIRAHRGVLCSPRLRDVSNGNYENGCPTSLIDCEGAVKYANYGYEFYGDYAGLKDNLPTRGGGSKACALAVLYDASINKYITYLCNDASKGLSGYSGVISKIIDEQKVLDPDHTCIAMDKIRKMANENRTGNWASWIEITLIRTAQQLGKC